MLEGYEFVCGDGKSGLLRGEFAGLVKDALLSGTGTAPDNASGRGTVYRFPLPRGSALVREYRRGGLLRYVNRDAYLTNRPLAELRIVDYLWRQDFPVPEPLGICWWRRCGLLRGRIATMALDALHLQDCLLTGSEPSSATLKKIGETIRRMHDLGVWHADLQVRNILVSGGRPFLIDFDKARKTKHLSSYARAANLFRLRRSFEKNYLDPKAYEMIFEGYGRLSRHLLLSFLYRVKSRASLSGPRK
ncbi:MAG TPA: lipopolysaccharide kinase InaA family protein [Candidatus Hydrogenedentes bacterium]|nr:lipopolysaccharide kinase InaA family protein [Candidatus Hydrogenedentota bacterium]HQE82479.1 lipopolysaccharide kinase InaA family protein [Candidatus Hydrogenedentota bacterium]HQM47715.1 lipopolysaccharide kinase InaA family protein [Candidatus Hydrogenedentota bacterium]